jgi:hypothetical protein
LWPELVHMGFVVSKVGLGQFFIEFFSPALSVSFHWGPILIYHLEDEYGCVGGHILERQSYPINKNNNRVLGPFHSILYSLQLLKMCC